MCKRWIQSPALLALLVFLLPTPAFGDASIDYIAEGDSMAAGYGATNHYGYVATKHYGYVDYFRDYLETLDTVDLTNAALPGLNSSGLLSQLRSDDGVREDIRGAEVLSISIGHDNLFPCASNNYATLNTTCATRGVAVFQNDWPKILDELRGRIRSRAKLYVTSIYNPYRGDESNYALAETYIKQINAVINNATYRSTYDYKVAEVYSHFQGQSGGTWKVCTWTHFCEDSRDPHPTDAGHKELAKLHQAIYR